ncbi:hypothetical protein D3C87_2126670 [compost metagenome]
MSEGDAFEHGTDQMALGVPAGDTVETRPRVAILLRSIEKRVVERIVRRRRDLGRQLAAQIEG